MRDAVGDGVLVEGTLTPHSRTGHSIHDVDRIEAASLSDFQPHRGRKTAAARHLRSLGFTVIDHGGPSLSVRGPKALFERVFHTALRVHADGRRVRTTDREKSGLVAIARRHHPDLASLARGVALDEPMRVFGSVSAAPPAVSYPHIQLPGQLATALRATDAHRAGYTGRGIKVVICDTGCYAHPWFGAHGFRVRVRLAAGATDTRTDPIGHGTMVAANLLSVAPGCNVTMIKLNADPKTGTCTGTVAALEQAASLDAAIISWSMGLSAETSADLPRAFGRTFEHTIAWLASHGRILLCASGDYPRGAPGARGAFGFPAQHPDVIAVGGAHVAARGVLSASSYASAFPSGLYPFRSVPDVSGICGNRPAGVMIMSPVEPACAMDQIAAKTHYPNGDDTAPDDGWCCVSGTSAATPQVAGVSALVLQANPALNHVSLMRALLSVTARDVTTGASNPGTGLRGKGFRATRGPDVATGAGLVDAALAVDTARAIRRQAWKGNGRARRRPSTVSR